MVVQGSNDNACDTDHKGCLLFSAYYVLNALYGVIHLSLQTSFGGRWGNQENEDQIGGGIVHLSDS